VSGKAGRFVEIRDKKRMEILLFDAFNGLIQGTFYALMALGLSLIISLNSVINFAHGGFMIVGAYLAFTLAPLIGFWPALVAGPIVAGLLGVAVERLLIRYMYRRSDPIYSLLLTFGLALIIEDMVRTIWGAQGLPFQIPATLGSPVSTTYFFITGYRLFVMGAIALSTAALFAFLRLTDFGIRIRAGILDLETVSVLGVNVYLLRSVNFAIGTLLAGFAGVLAAGVLQLAPTMGDNVIMATFVAVVVGGIGSLLGSVLGGLLIGLAAGVTTAYYPAASDVVIYVIMALVLIVRPRGILGQEGLFE
jgi:branched-chain amino acid transport system permease protein